MRFDILTLFPDFFDGFLHHSMIARGIQNKKIEIRIFNIRDFSLDKHKKVDDIPYGGGAGMVLTPQPLFDAITYVKKLKRDRAPVVYFSPQGKIFDQRVAEIYARDFGKKRVILLCGHYEGIDQRIRESLVDAEISLGNYVITGGELASQIFVDAVSRLLPGFLGADESAKEESFSFALGRRLEYPHYTRPAEFRGMRVPEILLSGHHAKISEWRKKMSKRSGMKKDLDA